MTELLRRETSQDELGNAGAEASLTAGGPGPRGALTIEQAKLGLAAPSAIEITIRVE